MKVILIVCIALSILAAIMLFFEGNSDAALQLLGGSIFLGVCYAVIERLDWIHSALTLKAAAEAPKPTLSVAVPPAKDFDTAAAVAAMEELRKKR
jgi:hypothetical protein